MSNRYTRKNPPSRKLRALRRRLRPAGGRARGAEGVEGPPSPRLRQDKYPRVIACGKINKHGRETRIAFEFMGKLSQGAVRRVFGENTARGEEIANL